MPIVFRLDVMLAKRKMELKSVSKILDLAEDKLELLLTGEVKAVNIDTLDGLCEALKCQPGDLFEYLPEKEYRRLLNANDESTFGLKYNVRQFKKTKK
jgi:putative transcriptional regulator